MKILSITYCYQYYSSQTVGVLPFLIMSDENREWDVQAVILRQHCMPVTCLPMMLREIIFWNEITVNKSIYGGDFMIVTKFYLNLKQLTTGKAVENFQSRHQYAIICTSMQLVTYRLLKSLSFSPNPVIFKQISGEHSGESTSENLSDVKFVID